MKRNCVRPVLISMPSVLYKCFIHVNTLHLVISLWEDGLLCSSRPARALTLRPHPTLHCYMSMWWAGFYYEQVSEAMVCSLCTTCWPLTVTNPIIVCNHHAIGYREVVSMNQNEHWTGLLGAIWWSNLPGHHTYRHPPTIALRSVY